MPEEKRIAVVTGASSGFGEATARSLAAAGFQLVVGARRMDRLTALASEIGGRAHQLDVTDPASISRFVEAIGTEFGKVEILVNNAGLAAGFEPIAEGHEEDWVQMMETNVLGLLRMTRSCLPLLRKAERAHIVNIGSVAGFEVYPGGVGYTASKHAVRAISGTLRLELLGEPIRVSEIAPGLAETEFSLVRYKGDAERAAAPYRGLQPLVASDVADCVLWVVTRPAHVNVDELVVRPIAQATTRDYARRPAATA